MMYMGISQDVTDATFLSSSLVENDVTDGALWLVGTAYAIGAIVRRPNHHRYRAFSANTGQIPENFPLIWQDLGFTNKWRPFDKQISSPATLGADITFNFQPAQRLDTIAFFGVVGTSIRVFVIDNSVTTYDRTMQLNNGAQVTDWQQYFYDPISFSSEMLFEGVPAYAGTSLSIIIAGTGTRQIGEIVMARRYELGKAMVGTSTGLLDFSRKEYDTFGNAIIIQRAFANKVEYQFVAPVTDVRRLKDLFSQVRARPTLFYTDNIAMGTLLYGFYKNFDVPYSNPARVFINLETEGLI